MAGNSILKDPAFSPVAEEAFLLQVEEGISGSLARAAARQRIRDREEKRAKLDQKMKARGWGNPIRVSAKGAKTLFEIGHSLKMASQKAKAGK